MVVQGGPGTGKTAVALHRAAYLLYNHRAQLEQRGVLIIGPEPDVPGLHQPGAALARRERRRAVHHRRPVPRGVGARATEEPEVARVKGRTAMTTVIANAVLHRQAMPAGTDQGAFDGAPDGSLQLDRALLTAARDRAWASRRPHNKARSVFVKRVIDGLVAQVADRLGRGPDGESLATADDLDAIRQDLLEHEGLRDALRDRLAGAHRAAPARRPLLLAGPARLRRRRPDRRRPRPAGTSGSTRRIGRRPTCRCSTRRRRSSVPSTCSAACGRRGRRPGLRLRGARHDGRRRVRGRDRTPTRSAWSAWSAPPTSPICTPRSPTGRPPPNAPRPTGSGPTVTSSSTRRRSCRRWRGGW